VESEDTEFTEPEPTKLSEVDRTELDLDKPTPVVQFASTSFYCLESEPYAMLDVIRIGDLSNYSELSFETEDLSAKAGDSYIATKGPVTFQPGQHTSRIKVALIYNDTWNTTTEFKVVLRRCGLSGAALGKYLSETRVQVIDTNVFPSDRFDAIDRGAASPRSVLFEFFTMAWRHPLVRRGTMWCLLVDLFRNVLHCLSLFLSVYLLNYIIHHDVELVLVHDRRLALVMYGGFGVVSVALLHVLDYSKLNTKISGTLSGFLQTALARKYLNLAAHVRQNVCEGDVVNAVQRDIPSVINNGFLGMIRGASELEKVASVMIFQFGSPVVFGTTFSLWGILPSFAFPIFLAVLLPLRGKAIVSAIDQEFDMENAVTDQIDLVIHNHPLVLDYDRRSISADSFKRCVDAHNSARRATLQTLLNNEYLTKWLTVLVMSLYVIIGGLRVLDGSLTIGMFVTNLKVVDSCGQSFESIFMILVDIQRTYPSMMNIFELLNLQTDVADRMRISRATEADTLSREETVLSRQHSTCSSTDPIPEDLIPIEINLYDNFIFEGTPKGGGVRLNFQGKFEINQGQMVAIVGSVGAGKATLLHLLAGRRLPDLARCTGDEKYGISLPSHLRVVSVCASPIFYSGTLFDNLTFGIDDPGTKSRARVIEICRMLGISKEVLAYLDLEEIWSNVFSDAQCKLLNIARALCFNAEVTCFHTPLAKLDQEHMPLVMQVFKTHIRGKGLAQEEPDDRPRTIFLTSSNPIAVMEAETIYMVNPTSGLSLVTHEMAEDMLASHFSERESKHRDQELKSFIGESRRTHIDEELEAGTEPIPEEDDENNDDEITQMTLAQQRKERRRSMRVLEVEDD
jgi:ABC-type multidrug transport system fused ATPase/permease subunit